MTNVQNTQSGATKAPPSTSAPPIPTMDQATPSALTASQIKQQARDIAKQARTASQDANNAARAGGLISTTAPAAVFNPADMIPPQAVDISLAFFLTVAFCIVGLPLARAFARRIDRKTEFKSVPGPDLRPQLQQLQESVDAMAIEMERISEGQRFTSKLLADRSQS